nr:unnamed protein product [Spirometra erinaceieuropaei]
MMQVQVDPSEDTEWNAILREKGILPPLPKPKEESPGPSPETKRREAAERLSYEKLTAKIESLEDAGQDEDEAKFFEEYRQKRLAEMRQAAARAKFGSVLEVTKADWVREINEAGKGVYVVVHIARKGSAASARSGRVSLDPEALEDRLAKASVIRTPERTEKSPKKTTLIRGRSSSSEDSD